MSSEMSIGSVGGSWRSAGPMTAGMGIVGPEAFMMILDEERRRGNATTVPRVTKPDRVESPAGRVQGSGRPRRRGSNTPPGDL